MFVVLYDSDTVTVNSVVIPYGVSTFKCCFVVPTIRSVSDVSLSPCRGFQTPARCKILLGQPARTIYTVHDKLNDTIFGNKKN